jgi:TolB protein
MFRRQSVIVAVVIAAAACDAPSSTAPSGPGAAPGAAADKQSTTGSQLLLSINLDDGNGAYQSEIFKMDEDGTNLVRLTYDLATSEGQASWAPDGKRIVFTRYYSDHSAIFVMNADGTGVTQLTFTQSPWADQQPIAFGKQIAFARFADGVQAIHVMNADGTGVTQFPQTSGGSNPAPSPKGDRIAFWLASDIYLLDVATGGVTNLTNSADAEDEPAYSPSGKQIAFTRNGADGGIFIMNDDGTQVTRVTMDPSDRGPRWSPDGKRIAFYSDRDVSEDIYVVNVNGTGLTDLTRAPQTGEFLTAWARK